MVHQWYSSGTTVIYQWHTRGSPGRPQAGRAAGPPVGPAGGAPPAGTPVCPWRRRLPTRRPGRKERGVHEREGGQRGKALVGCAAWHRTADLCTRQDLPYTGGGCSNRRHRGAVGMQRIPRLPVHSVHPCIPCIPLYFVHATLYWVCPLTVSLQRVGRGGLEAAGPDGSQRRAARGCAPC